MMRPNRSLLCLSLGIVLGTVVCGVSTLSATPLPKADRTHADRLPRKFVGTFQWRHSVNPDKVTLVIEKVEVRLDGVLVVEGYDIHPGNRAKVTGTINPKTRRLSMKESEPQRNGGFVTDGSYEGEISEDFLTLTAVWTTTSDGSAGDLQLKAEK